MRKIPSIQTLLGGSLKPESSLTPAELEHYVWLLKELKRATDPSLWRVAVRFYAVLILLSIASAVSMYELDFHLLYSIVLVLPILVTGIWSHYMILWARYKKAYELLSSFLVSIETNRCMGHEHATAAIRRVFDLAYKMGLRRGFFT